MILFRNRLHVLRSPDDEAAPGGEAVGTGNDARLKLLDQINDKNDVDRAAELANVNDDDTTEPFQAPALADPDADEPAAGDTTPQADEPAAEPQKVKLVVNGTEREVTLEEALALAQKVAAADEYLEQARAAKKAAAADPEEPTPHSPTPEELARKRLEEDRALVRAIQQGTEEEAIAALNKLRTPVSLDEIGRTVDERLAFDRALDWFNTEYSDLVEDIQLHQIVLRRDEELVKSGDRRTYRERYKAIGDEVRAWRDNIVKKHAETHPAPEDTIKDKAEAKRTAPKVPVAAAGKNTPRRDDEEPEESASQVIANMSKARGGPHWMRG